MAALKETRAWCGWLCVQPVPDEGCSWLRRKLLPETPWSDEQVSSPCIPALNTQQLQCRANWKVFIIGPSSGVVNRATSCEDAPRATSCRKHLGCLNPNAQDSGHLGIYVSSAGPEPPIKIEISNRRNLRKYTRMWKLNDTPLNNQWVKGKLKKSLRQTKMSVTFLSYRTCRVARIYPITRWASRTPEHWGWGREGVQLGSAGQSWGWGERQRK